MGIYDFLKGFGMLVVVSLVTCTLLYLVFGRLDSSFDNKDRMLCNSAQVSGNEVYLKKCICYYAGDNIRCIYKENK